jgi:hypothetical protein
MRLLSITLKKKEEIKSIEKRIAVKLKKFNIVQFKVCGKVLNNIMIAFKCILKANGILDKDKKCKSLKEMVDSNE